MLTTATEILQIIQNLPQPVLEEVRMFLDFLTWRYLENPPLKRGSDMIAAMRGNATTGMTSDEILNLTRGKE
jgi:hypothetical protein